MVETSPYGGDFKCLELSFSPWNKDHGTWTKRRFMSPICSRIGQGWPRHPFHGTWDFCISFWVSLLVTLVYGNSKTTIDICTWISGSKNLSFENKSVDGTFLHVYPSLLPFLPRCCLSAWRCLKKKTPKRNFQTSNVSHWIPPISSWNPLQPTISLMVGHQLDDEPNLYIGNGWKSPYFHP